MWNEFKDWLHSWQPAFVLYEERLAWMDLQYLVYSPGQRGHPRVRAIAEEGDQRFR